MKPFFLKTQIYSIRCQSLHNFVPKYVKTLVCIMRTSILLEEEFDCLPLDVVTVYVGSELDLGIPAPPPAPRDLGFGGIVSKLWPIYIDGEQ